MLALFVASLCHDLDHRGFTNNFFEINNSPLAALYSTSIMENHHFDQTLAILQTPGVDLFSSFDANSFKQVTHACLFCCMLSTWYIRCRFFTAWSMPYYQLTLAAWRKGKENSRNSLTRGHLIGQTIHTS